MFSMNDEGTLKNIKYQFCYSSTMEELMSLHVMAEREKHPICGDFAMYIRGQLTEKLREEIDFWGENFGSWHYVLDLCGAIVEESANYQCDLPLVIQKMSEMSEAEFLYYVLGVASIPQFDPTLEQFVLWCQDSGRCLAELKGRGYHLIGDQQVCYLIDHAGEMRQRLIGLLRDYWDQAFEEEWKGISDYVREIIVHEELSLGHSNLRDYLRSFHSQLKIQDGLLVFELSPRISIELKRIESLTFTPTIFGDTHLHGGIYGTRVNIGLNLNYRAIHISKTIPENYFQLLRAISDETRFKILKVLWQGEATTKEISEILRLSPSTISLHLKVLKDADLVSSNKVKKFVYYYIKKSRLETLQENTIKYLKY